MMKRRVNRKILSKVQIQIISIQRLLCEIPHEKHEKYLVRDEKKNVILSSPSYYSRYLFLKYSMEGDWSSLKI